MTYDETCAYLYSLERRGVRLGLDRVVGAFREQGDPQEAFGSVLVGGTNGKGSVAALTASCLTAAGHKTGLFTSPHLVDFRERIRIDGRVISETELTDLLPLVRGSIERWHLSFFEATTLIAFLWFRQQGAKVAAVEVGLGGRLDATRPVRALATAITSIGLDHVRILGSTRTAIAHEKAGILRAGAPVSLGVHAIDAVDVLRSRARDLGVDLYERRRCLMIRGIEPSGTGSRFRLTPSHPCPGPRGTLDLEIGLAGHHQVANAALTALTLRLLPDPFRVDEEELRLGLRRARWPGRFEEIGDRPRLICDVAHNRDGARWLASTLATRKIRSIRLVIGMVDQKDHEGFLSALSDSIRFAHVCAPQNDRALPGDFLAAIAARLGLPTSIHSSCAEAIDAALSSAGPDETILVTGSFFTVGEVFTHLGVDTLTPLWHDRPAVGAGDR